MEGRRGAIDKIKGSGRVPYVEEVVSAKSRYKKQLTCRLGSRSVWHGNRAVTRHEFGAPREVRSPRVFLPCRI